MQKHLYEYAVIRLVPRIEREEFLNIGLLLFSKKADFIKFRYQVDEKKLSCFSHDLDMELVFSTLDTFGKIASGHPEGGVIARLDVPERFRWLTAMKSSCIQTSRPHSGFASDLEERFEKLFQEMV